MENILTLFGINLAAALGFMFIGWIISLVRRNVTIADSFWGIGFIIITWLTFFTADGFWARKAIISLLVTIWGLRLCLHLTFRNRGRGEDPRYASWREKHGDSFWIVSLFKVFIIQALFQWLIAAGVQYGQMSRIPEHITWLDLAGILIWTAGFIIETAADLQLAKFLKDPANRGKIMNLYLWRYSRHPNYFGESLIWWGLFMIVLSTPWGFWTIISPLLITYTLLRLTGVTLMEATEFSGNPEYASYIEQTSAFILWFPKKNNKL